MKKMFPLSFGYDDSKSCKYFNMISYAQSIFDLMMYKNII